MKTVILPIASGILIMFAGCGHLRHRFGFNKWRAVRIGPLRARKNGG